tara:strand:+ start:79 stop:336 length:258 start_codon:yes stop_codon:yes gene_type:complete
MTPTARIALAAGANLGAWGYLARCVGLPRWSGMTVAGVSMALATARAPLPPAGRVVVRFVNAPGQLVVGLLESPELQELQREPGP